MNRRRVIGLAGGMLAAGAGARAADRPIGVLIWDEQQPIQKQAYENFLGNALADHLRSRGSDFRVKSVRQDDPQQGLVAEDLDAARVLIWWGHARHTEVKPKTCRPIIERIRAGKLSLLAVHSAHFSTPFIECMNARAMDDVLETLSKEEREKVRWKLVPAPRRLSRPDDPPTPSHTRTAAPDGAIEIQLRLPNCVFPAVRADGKPGHLRTLLPKHPIARGVPEAFDIPQTEMYSEPFGVPPPDAVIFEERWDAGEHFRSGCLWKLGKGEVFYFRPGHETYPIFKQEIPLRIIENACRYLGRSSR